MKFLEIYYFSNKVDNGIKYKSIDNLVQKDFANQELIKFIDKKSGKELYFQIFYNKDNYKAYFLAYKDIKGGLHKVLLSTISIKDARFKLKQWIKYNI